MSQHRQAATHELQAGWQNDARLLHVRHVHSTGTACMDAWHALEPSTSFEHEVQRLAQYGVLEFAELKCEQDSHGLVHSSAGHEGARGQRSMGSRNVHGLLPCPLVVHLLNVWCLMDAVLRRLVCNVCRMWHLEARIQYFSAAC